MLRHRVNGGALREPLLGWAQDTPYCSREQRPEFVENDHGMENGRQMQMPSFDDTLIYHHKDRRGVSDSPSFQSQSQMQSQSQIQTQTQIQAHSQWKGWQQIVLEAIQEAWERLSAVLAARFSRTGVPVPNSAIRLSESERKAFRDSWRVAFEPGKHEHETMLRELWKVWTGGAGGDSSQAAQKHQQEADEFWGPVWPTTEPGAEPGATAEEYQRTGKHWGRLGFQGVDPATDLRGAGLFGLRELVQLGLREPALVQRAIERQDERNGGRGYPVAIVGLSVLISVLDLFGESMVVPRSPGDDAYKHLLWKYLDDSDDAIGELFAIMFRMLDTEWDLQNGMNVMDYPRILNSVKVKLHLVLLQRKPQTTAELSRTVAELGHINLMD